MEEELRKLNEALALVQKTEVSAISIFPTGTVVTDTDQSVRRNHTKKGKTSGSGLGTGVVKGKSAAESSIKPSEPVGHALTGEKVADHSKLIHDVDNDKVIVVVDDDDMIVVDSPQQRKCEDGGDQSSLQPTEGVVTADDHDPSFSKTSVF